MGKYMKKSKTAGEVAVMEVGVRTRARTLALQSLPSAASVAFLQLRSRRLPKPVDVVQVGCEETNEISCKESSKGGAHVGRFLPRECVGRVEPILEASSAVEKECFPVDDRRNMRESMPSSPIIACENVGTTRATTRAVKCGGNNWRTPNIIHDGMPSIQEINKFFDSTEHLHEIFSEKYNYDFVNDLPQPGRYEWERLV